MIYYRCGGTGEKSLVLPDNISSFTIYSGDGELRLTWALPENSEVEIDKFNIYTCKTDVAPTSLSDFTLHGSVSSTATNYTINGLDNDSNYYVVIESVTSEEYENASLRNMNNGIPGNAILLS